MYLGIEIGGTKLQLGVGSGREARPVHMERLPIDAARGAEQILRQIEQTGRMLCDRYDVRGVAFGFGGPIDTVRGRVITSHQVDGWDDFPLGPWCAERLGRPTTLENDCNAAALGEARFGAGQGCRRVFYVTAGTGVGGGMVVDGRLYGTDRPAVAEIGHLRPGLEAVDSKQTVESFSSGWGIVSSVKRDPAMIGDEPAESEAADVREILTACDGDLERLTGQQTAELAQRGNAIAARAVEQGIRTLGWAVAQVVTLTTVEVVIVGGGVSLMGEAQFYRPLRQWAARYAFPPLRDHFEILPPALGEDVVVCGALAVAADADQAGQGGA